jgi:hypothetical protein
MKDGWPVTDNAVHIRVGSPEGGSTINREACLEFTNGTCEATCLMVGECALANSVADQLKAAATAPVSGKPPTTSEVFVIMDEMGL